MNNRHRVFVSYYHAEDQDYRERFELLFSDIHDIMVSESVEIGDIDPNLKTETIRQKIRDEYLRDSTVTVVLSDIVLGTLPGGVSKEKAAELKQLAEDGEFEDFSNKIHIQRSVRFAPLIFLGVILTILCRGPFFTLFQ